MFKLFVVGIGGFAGAVARYGASGLVHRWFRGSFPLGTAVVNVLGCLAIGMLMTLVEDRQFFTPTTRLFILIGFLGSFTTFSTFGYETFALARDSEFALVLLDIALNLGLGLVAVWVGHAVIRGIGI